MYIKSILIIYLAKEFGALFLGPAESWGNFGFAEGLRPLVEVSRPKFLVIPSLKLPYDLH